MKIYILSLVCAAVASSIIGLFFHGDEKIGKFVRLAISLCVIAFFIPSGLKSVKVLKNEIENKFSLTTFGSYDDEDYLNEINQSYEKYIIENTRKEMCSKIKYLIFEKSGIMPLSVDIQFNVEITEEKIDITISSVEIISDELIENHEIEKYVYNLTKVMPHIKKSTEMVTKNE